MNHLVRSAGQMVPLVHPVPLQLEWNAMSEQALGTGRQPVADLLARHGYQLYRPDPACHHAVPCG